MEPTASSSQENASLSRRRFVSGTVLASTGLLAPTLLAQQAGSVPRPVNRLFDVPTQNGEYQLPKLPYAYEALEPHIDAQTMQLHHDRHFRSYMEGLNKALKKLQQPDIEELSYWENQLAFHGSGYMLHAVFFGNLAPEGSTRVSATLERHLSSAFGSMDAFKLLFGNAAKKVEGSGWAVLAYQPFGGRLVVQQHEKHQNHYTPAAIPLLCLDVWEHAYYLKYQNRRAAYVDAFWNVVNWDDVAQRLEAATSLAS